MSKALTETLYKEVTKNITKEKTQKIMLYISNYIDKNSEVLSSNIPAYRLFFNDTDKLFIFSLLDLDPNIIDDYMEKVTEVKSNWKILNNSFNILSLELIRYYYITKNKQAMELVLMYEVLFLYSSLHYKFYPYLPNVNCMQYTYNRLSDKYLFRKYGVLSKALYATAEGNHEKYKNTNLINNDDKKFLDYLMNLRTRLNNQLKVFTNEYRKDQTSGNYLNTTEDSYDEEDFRMNDNVSGLVVGIINKACNNFFTSDIDYKILNTACGICKTEKIIVKNALKSIKDNEGEKIRKLFLSILQVYLRDKKNSLDSIGSQKFFAYCLSLYTKSNTKDDAIINIKNTLDEFLTKHCLRYAETEREATKSNYRKTIYIYFVLLLNYAKTAGFR